MIKILPRYLARIIIQATLLVSLIVMSVLFLILLLGELKYLGMGDYHFLQAMFYVLMRLPNELYQFSPILILLGSTVGLSILSSYRELAVMRTAGFSIKQIFASVFFAALLMVLLMGMIGEWLGPRWSYKAEIYKENQQNAGQAVITAAGVWLHVDNDFIHIQRVIGRQLLEGVTRYEFDQAHHLKSAAYAKTLTLENKQWYMNEVAITNFYRDHTSHMQLARAKWDIKFNLNLFNIGLVNPTEMTLHRLYLFAKYLRDNNLQYSEYQYHFWQRILQPLASLLMVFLALPFVLSVFSAATMGWRILVGILTGFVFFISNALLGQLCMVYQLPTLLAAVLPLGLFAAVGFFLSKRLLR